MALVVDIEITNLRNVQLECDVFHIRGTVYWICTCGRDNRASGQNISMALMWTL